MIETRGLVGMIEAADAMLKTANVVLNCAYGVASGIIVDTHVERLAQRIGLSQHDTPEKILKAAVDPRTGLLPFQARRLAHELGFPPEQAAQAVAALWSPAERQALLEQHRSLRLALRDWVDQRITSLGGPVELAYQRRLTFSGIEELLTMTRIRMLLDRTIAVAEDDCRRRCPGPVARQGCHRSHSGERFLGSRARASGLSRTSSGRLYMPFRATELEAPSPRWCGIEAARSFLTSDRHRRITGFR